VTFFLSRELDVLTVVHSPWTPDIPTPRVSPTTLSPPTHHHPRKSPTNNPTTTDDWELFVAATSKPSLRDRFVSTIAAWLGSTPTNFAFTDLYDTVTGE
jgi:hypothetical protein